MTGPQRFTSVQLSYALRIERAIRAIEQLREEALTLETEFAPALSRTAPEARESAYNLIHYLALRRHDIRELQYELSVLGLSSLGRLEAHVMASLNAVLIALYRLMEREAPAELLLPPPITFEIGRELLAEHTLVALGPPPQQRLTHIMVTMPSEAAEDPAIIRNLLADGMNIMRVNCAHDGPEAWLKMIQHLRQAEAELGIACKVSFDLAGPKLRTEAIAAGDEVIKWRPQRNHLGAVIQPARIWLTPTAAGEAQAAAAVVIPVETAVAVQAGDVIRLTDARQRRRQLRVVEVAAGGWLCECDRTGYVTSTMPFDILRDQVKIGGGTIGKLPPLAQSISLKTGDCLRVMQGSRPGQPAVLDAAGQVVVPACVSCALPEVFQDVKPGERIFFDDGKIAGVIQTVGAAEFTVDITSAVNGIAKLKGEKGINLPDTALNLPALPPKDLEDLEFAAQHGDLVALSFVQKPEHLEQLVRELARLQAKEIGIILKIETRRGFENLPRLLITAMQRPPVAVMIARGDLGVEVGFERMSEVQEEILLLCQAAHVPSIWATQVLESLAKGGLPSRAEVTDAAMASRAECVMLNKGPYIERTMQFLNDVLQRMQENFEKNMATLRKLRISEIEAEDVEEIGARFP
jgi:pyruvate kinase